MPQTQIRALLFDVFGTVVDWRSSVSAELEALGKKTGAPPGALIKDHSQSFPSTKLIVLYLLTLDTDWIQFAEEWRAGYMKNTFVFRISCFHWSVRLKKSSCPRFKADCR